MPPEERRRFVRGVCCIACNHFVLTRFAKAYMHDNASLYLRLYERRRDSGATPTTVPLHEK
jgi:hypothetical protein